MMEFFKGVVMFFKHEENPELTTSRQMTEDLKERTALTRTLIDNPQELTRHDIAKLITARGGPVQSYIYGSGKPNE